MSTLLVTDLDGTLWDDKEICHPKTLAAVAELERRGIPLLVATGRRLRGVERGFELNGLQLPAIVVNGASAFDFKTGTSLFDEPFEPAMIADIIGRLQQVDLSPVLFTSPDRVLIGPNATAAAEYIPSVITGLVQTDDVLEFVAEHDTAVLGFTLMSMTGEQLDRARKALSELNFDEYSYHRDQYFAGWMVMGQPPGVNKWTGIRRYINDVLGPVDRIVAVGDSANDVPMFAGADLSVWVDGGTGDPSMAELTDLKIEGPSVGGWEAMVDLVR